MARKENLLEVLRFALAGGVCFLIELGVFTGLHAGLGLDTLIATPIAFLVSVIVNYLLCVRWVFHGAAEQGGGAKAGFLITSLIGLLLNEGLMLLLRVIFGEEQVLFTLFGFGVTMAMVNKCIATLLVMVWNYFTKKAILQSSLAARLGEKFRR